MKRFFIVNLLVAFIMVGCKNKPGQGATMPMAVAAAGDTATYTTIQWLDTLENVGKLTFGDVATIKFRFMNSGTKPLFIVSAEPGCGCTIANYPKGAIAPGIEGVVTAAFDTNKGQVGAFRKSINVITNTRQSTYKILYFMGQITSAGEATKGGPEKKPGEGKTRVNLPQKKIS